MSSIFKKNAKEKWGTTHLNFFAPVSKMKR